MSGNLTSSLTHQGVTRLMRHENTTHGSLPAAGFVRQKALMPCLPFSPATLWRRVSAGTFPKPVKISTRITAWKVDEIWEWIESQ
ncbi:AlpA family phage regulatory protein [Yersinia enterocolitica]|nr:AlpA family phage regulatory protein [Yersinia enterocolitica]ELI8386377.1 AlpA family phage regulatory protein [Yersinia enterocolitica]ELZ4050829.1 AlpA family phage regulatory protein [Yersinia enterocolitica]EMD8447277.1 AlpA family phage regulatory protein [Yersinia enterocolitica]EME2526862.1 AlpA family phage regulatory protein [Yersinia enterocolitica]